MKTKLRHLATFGAFGLALTLSSCVSPYAGPNEQSGAVAGALGGGALGAIIGNQSGRPLEGAAIGGLLGSLAGASLGASNDQYYGYRQPAYYRPVPRYSYAPYGYGYRPYRSHVYVSGYRYGPAYGYGRGPRCW